MKHAIFSVVIGLCLAVSPAWAGPGDPFGGDDTGCVPADKVGLGCGVKLSKALLKLNVSVIKCHLTQADHAYQTGHSSPGFDNAEENCEEGPSNTSAKNKFDNYLANNAADICDPAPLAAAQARGDALVPALDALNGNFFCDSTSGSTIAEPGGDDAGYIPSTEAHNKCSVLVAKLYGKLIASVYKCHYTAAKYGLSSKPFDEDACEDALGPDSKSALARYQAKLQKLIDVGYCPPCLGDPPATPPAFALATSAISDLDANNDDLFPCP